MQKIPIPQKPVTPPDVEPPKSVLTVYPIQHANPLQAGEVLKQIIAGTVVVDEKAMQISVNAIPAEQDKAKTIIAQLESNQGPDMQREAATVLSDGFRCRSDACDRETDCAGWPVSH